MAKGAYSVLAYPESSDIQKILDSILASGAEYSYILHDKDTWDEDGEDKQGNKHKAGELKKPHYHILIGWETGFPQNFKKWKTEFCEPLGIVAPSKKQCLVRNPQKAYDYLIHKDAP